MAEDQDSLLREVEEELRREQMQKIWERYNGLIIGGAAAIVAGVVGYNYYQSSQKAAAQAAGADFSKALRLMDDEKTADDAIKTFEALAKSGPSGYAALARLQVAAAQKKAGKTKEALASFDALAQDAGADRLLKQYAALQAVSLQMGDADFKDIEKRAKPLTGASMPYNTTASEFLGLAAYKAGELAKARSYLEPLLIDPAASEALQERIKIVLSDIATAELASTGNPEKAEKAEQTADKPAAPKASTSESPDKKDD